MYTNGFIFGTGIVTRRPLVLQLVRDASATSDWAEFSHNSGVNYDDFNLVRDEIQRETDRVTGGNKGISPWPISLKVHSSSVLDLTLVDLPGMTKVPVGDQPEDIEAQIRSMLMTFVSSPSCLILAVVPANADLATADAIKLAQEVDPKGERTLGVLTKLDLMDEGTDAKEMLQNQVIPLRYGWVGIVNRGQKDITGRKDIGSALKDEVKFFDEHPAYKHMKDVLGTPYLCKQLNEHLTMHIARNLPTLRAQLRDQIDKTRQDLKRFEKDYDFDFDDPQWKPKAVVCLAISFANYLRHELLGGDSDRVLPLDTYNTGTRIMSLFKNTYCDMLMSTEMTQESVMKREIGYAIQNILGVRTGLFTPDKAFDIVIRSQLSKLEEPTLAFIDLVYDLMFAAIKESLQTLNEFPEFAKMIENKASYVVASQIDKTREGARALLDYERGYINTKHEDFVGFNYAEQKAYSRIMKRRLPGQSIITKGYLGLYEGSLKGYKRYFFTITPDALSWYTDDSEERRIYILPVDENLKLKDVQKDNKFTVYGENERNIFKDKSRLELQAFDYANLEMWKKSLSQVGVFPDNSTALIMNVPQSTSGGILDSDDPWLERQIESLWILVNSYMNIVCRTLTDMVPKCIVHSLIKCSVAKLEKQLIAEVSQISDLDELFQFDEREEARRTSLKASLIACEEALENLRNVSIPKFTLEAKPNYTPSKQISQNMRKSWSTPAFPETPAPPKPPPTPPNKPTGLMDRRGLGSKPNLRDSKRKVSKEIQKIDSSQRSQFYDKI